MYILASIYTIIIGWYCYKGFLAIRKPIIQFWNRLNIMEKIVVFVLGVPWTFYLVLHILLTIFIISIYIFSIFYKPIEIARIAEVVDIDSLIRATKPIITLTFLDNFNFSIVTNMPVMLYIYTLRWLG